MLQSDLTSNPLNVRHSRCTRTVHEHHSHVRVIHADDSIPYCFHLQQVDSSAEHQLRLDIFHVRGVEHYNMRCGGSVGLCLAQNEDVFSSVLSHGDGTCLS